jgi:hypothetical protein
MSYSNSSDRAASQEVPVIEISPKSIDFGEIPISMVVSHQFIITNVSMEEVEIQVSEQQAVSPAEPKAEKRTPSSGLQVTLLISHLQQILA